MSYDLTFLRKAADQSWEEAFEALEDEAEDDASGDLLGGEAWVAVLAATRDVLGDVAVLDGDRFYELDHEPTGIQVSVYPGSAAITVPYWYRGLEAENVVRKIYELGLILQRHTGLDGYDAQVGLPVVDAATRPELAVAIFDQVADSFDQRGIKSPSNRA